MTRRVVIGRRGNGNYGIFISPPGVDAFTASDDQLTLNVSDRIPQLLQLGVLYSTGSVYMGLGVRPHVLLFGSGNTTGELPGYSGIVGVSRPAPLFAGDPQAYADIASDGSSMTLTCGARTIYAVYNTQL
jgi:hypothetical protein